MYIRINKYGEEITPLNSLPYGAKYAGNNLYFDVDEYFYIEISASLNDCIYKNYDGTISAIGDVRFYYNINKTICAIDDYRYYYNVKGYLYDANDIRIYYDTYDRVYDVNGHRIYR